MRAAALRATAFVTVDAFELQRFRRELSERVAAARKAQHEGDPLLDIRSASLPELARLVRGAFERMGEEVPADIDGSGEETQVAIEEALVTLSRWLEEELEDVVVEVGRRVGMEVDTDQNVHPFEVAFTLGAGMKIEALPGVRANGSLRDPSSGTSCG